MFSETIELRGHIIDSLILPKVLDQILTHGANFKIGEITIGQKRADQSFARIEVSAETSDALDELILRLRQHGAEVAERTDAQLAPAPADGVFPPEFYVMTNQQTFVRVDGKEIEVRPTMMDTAIAVDRKGRAARAVKFFDVRKGDEIVIGHQGVRVVPVQRATSRTDIFQFINTIIDADEPKSAIIRELAEELRRARKAKGKIAVVAGPAIVRTGADQHLVRLIEAGMSIDFSPEIHLPVTTWNERCSALLWALASTWRSRAAAARTLCARSMRFAKPAALPQLLRKIS